MKRPRKYRNTAPDRMSDPPPVEVVDLSGRRDWGEKVPPAVDLIPFGRTRTLALNPAVAPAAQLPPVGAGVPDPKLVAAFLFELRDARINNRIFNRTDLQDKWKEIVRFPNVWPEFDGLLTDYWDRGTLRSLLDIAGVGLARRWLNFVQGHAKAEAVRWLMDNWEMVWEDLSADEQKMIVKRYQTLTSEAQAQVRSLQDMMMHSFGGRMGGKFGEEALRLQERIVQALANLAKAWPSTAQPPKPPSK